MHGRFRRYGLAITVLGFVIGYLLYLNVAGALADFCGWPVVACGGAWLAFCAVPFLVGLVMFLDGQDPDWF